MSTTDHRPGPARKRMTRDEVESRMVKAAQQIVNEAGLTIGFDHFRMDRMIEAAGVPRSSVYRLWPAKEDFLAYFLPTLAMPQTGNSPAYDEMTQEVGVSVLLTNADLLVTREGRIAVAREAVRMAVDRNFSAMTEDGRWRAFEILTLAASNSADPKLREPVRNAVRDADLGFVEAMGSFYERTLPVLRAQFKPGINGLHLAATGAAIVEGLVVRRIQNPQLVDPPVPGPALRGGTTDWSLAALGFWGVLTQCVYFLENDGSISSPEAGE